MENAAAALEQEITESRRRAQELVSGLTAEQLARRPDPAKWSIAECIAHLNKTGAVVQPMISKSIEIGRKQNLLGKGPFKLGGKGRLLIWIASPPPKFRIRAPKSVAPPATIPEPDRLLDEFMKVQDGWARLWRDADGLDLARINIAPLFSPFRCHLSASFPWMMAHQRRHLLQAENVKRQIAADAALPAVKNA